MATTKKATTKKVASRKNSIFKTLIKVDVSKHTFDKPANKSKTVWLTYLNWAWAYSYLMYYDPDATYHFKQFPEYDFDAHQLTGRKVDYMNTINGAYVTAVITIKGKTKEQSLPVMTATNKTFMNPTITAINKAKQRAFVKCLALFGLGLSLYMGDNAASYSNGGSSNGNNYQRGNNSGSNNNEPTDKQKSTIKWLIKIVGPKVEGKDADKFSQLEKACGTPKGASNFIGWLYKKKDALGNKPKQPQQPTTTGRTESDRIGSTGNVKQGSMF